MTRDYRLTRWFRLTVTALVAVACVVYAFAQAKRVVEVAGTKPSISITRVPTDPPGEALAKTPIEGTVTGVDPENCKLKVVVYAYGDKWYVQPWAASPYTKIARDGTWSTPTHGGYEFAALLVEPSFKPPATTYELPEVGGTVLAIARKRAAGF